MKPLPHRYKFRTTKVTAQLSPSDQAAVAKARVLATKIVSELKSLAVVTGHAPLSGLSVESKASVVMAGPVLKPRSPKGGRAPRVRSLSQG